MNVSPVKPDISYDHFEKLDIRVGTIPRVEEFKGADMLRPVPNGARAA